MAERKVFIAKPENNIPCEEKIVTFDYYPGFAVSQKQKSILSLHKNIVLSDPDLKPLEISTKSTEPLGVRLSAFNLMFTDEISHKKYHLENVFQSSKVYELGGPYRDLLNVAPVDAKRAERHTRSGKLIHFEWYDWKCSLEPKTMFYDWIYCKALSQNRDIADALLDSCYNAFTDIEFNHKKSINCQARSAAIFVAVSKRKKIEEYLNDKNKWRSLYEEDSKPIETQITFAEYI